MQRITHKDRVTVSLNSDDLFALDMAFGRAWFNALDEIRNASTDGDAAIWQSIADGYHRRMMQVQAWRKDVK